MKVLVAGATGALGRQLVPRLAEAGHQVTGMTRTEGKRELLRELGARPVVADGLDPEQMAKAVAETEPEVIVHELTALSGNPDWRNFDRSFALTNRLRTEGTDNLLAAGRAMGLRRFVAQSFAGWPYARSGFDADPPASMRETLGALRHLELAVTSAEWTEGIVLRYGGFYGPGTSLTPEGEFAEMIRKRRFPVVGSGEGVSSFIQIEDAAEATLAAVERGRRGVYNVVDDEPLPAREWLPALAEAMGAKPPRHFPRWLGRLLAGEAATEMMTEVRGASNRKAKRELGWEPRHPNLRVGFAEMT
jgi:nucleoside-diphosphate-sugar epimerase